MKSTSQNDRGQRSVVAISLYLVIVMGAGPVVHFALSALGPHLTTALNLSAASFGGLWFFLFATAVIVSAILRSAVDNYLRRFLLLIFASAGTATLVASAGSSYLALLVAVVFVGIAQGVSNPATNVVIATEVADEYKNVAVGVKQAGVTASQFAVGLIVPVVAVMFGWRVALAASLVVLIIGVALTFLMIPASSTSNLGKGDRLKRKLPATVWILALCSFAMGLITQVVNVHLPLFAHEVAGFSFERSGLLIGVLGASGVFSRLAWGVLSRDKKRLWRYIWVQTFGALAAVIILALSPYVGDGLVWVGAIMIGATASASAVTTMIGVFLHASVKDVGRASSVIATGMYAGYMVGPVIFGKLVDLLGFHAAWWALAGSTLFFALVMLMLRTRPANYVPVSHV